MNRRIFIELLYICGSFFDRLISKSFIWEFDPASPEGGIPMALYVACIRIRT